MFSASCSLFVVSSILVIGLLLSPHSTRRHNVLALSLCYEQGKLHCTLDRVIEC